MLSMFRLDRPASGQPGRHRRLAVWHQPQPEAPVLLLHGVTYSSRSVFDLAVPGHPREEYSLIRGLAARGHDVYALDLAGYGMSDDDPLADLGSQVRDVRHVLDEIRDRTGITPALLGWSWGAQVAARLANEHPDRLRALVFWGSFWGGGSVARPVTAPPPGGRRVNTVEHAAADFATPAHYDAFVRDAFVRMALVVDPTSPVVGRVEVAAGVPLHDPARISVPLLALRGSHDPICDPVDLAEYVARVPHGDKALVEIAGSDHNTQFSHGRHELVDHLDEFLRTT